MPLFEYECRNCGKIFEELIFSSRIADDKIECPHCGFKRAKKLISAPAIGSVSDKTTGNSHTCGAGGFT